MVKFRCRRSGNCVTFTNEDDIKQLRTHEGYEEIKDDPKETTLSTKDESPQSPVDNAHEKDANEGNNGQDGQHEGQKGIVLKKRGRPAKK